VNQTSFGQITLSFGGFLSQDVAFVSVLPFDFSCSGQSETLFSGRFGFYFWHFSYF
jgi:hypothetical protein